MEDIDHNNQMDLSVVLPVYNEEENLRPLYKELITTLDQGSSTYEIVFQKYSSSSLSYTLATLSSIRKSSFIKTHKTFFGKLGSIMLPFFQWP